MTIEFCPLSDDGHFILRADQPVSIEVVADGQVQAYVYRSMHPNAEDDPVGGYDTTADTSERWGYRDEGSLPPPSHIVDWPQNEPPSLAELRRHLTTEHHNLTVQKMMLLDMGQLLAHHVAEHDDPDEKPMHDHKDTAPLSATIDSERLPAIEYIAPPLRFDRLRDHLGRRHGGHGVAGTTTMADLVASHDDAHNTQTFSGDDDHVHQRPSVEQPFRDVIDAEYAQDAPLKRKLPPPHLEWNLPLEEGEPEDARVTLQAVIVVNRGITVELSYQRDPSQWQVKAPGFIRYYKTFADARRIAMALTNILADRRELEQRLDLLGMEG
jgi:hypothetical protein